jgi:hypothetical protein
MIKSFLYILAILNLALLFQSCQQSTKIDFEREEKLILQLDEQTRQAHFTKNARAMAEGASNDFISISNGLISKPTYEERFHRFDTYFKSVEFVKWDNVTPPVVRFSDDASIAYVTIDKLVVLKLKDEPEKSDTTHFAWLSVFKKLQGKWVLDCIASTNQ